jgi:hypothetical protein
MSKYSKVVIDVIGEKFDKVWERINKGFDVEATLNYGVTQLFAKRKQATDAGYLGINAEAKRQFANNNYPVQDMDKMRNAIIKYAPAKLFLTINLRDVRTQVFSAVLANENLPVDKQMKVVVFRPFKQFSTVDGKKHAIAIKDAAHWASLLDEEHKANVDYAINQERLMDNLHLINSPQQWLGTKTLATILHSMNDNFGALLQYCQLIIDSIEHEGVWDAEMHVSERKVDGQKLYMGYESKGSALTVDGVEVANKGTGIGARKLVYHENDRQFKVYEPSDADILQHFLTLTFYKAVGIKPMQKMVLAPTTPGYMELVPMNPEDEFDAEYFKSTGFVTTPIYVTPEQSHKKFCVQGYVNPKVVYELPDVK